MTGNICQVLKESDLDEIMSNYTHELVLIMYSAKTCPPCKVIKPVFISLSKKELNSQFVYIDIDNFVGTEYKYTRNLEATPKFSFYLGGQEIAFVMGADKNALLGTFYNLKQRIENKKRDMLIQQTQPVVPLQQAQPVAPQPLPAVPSPEKIDVLNKLYSLANNGVQLTRPYTINSDFKDMVDEYEFHIKRLSLDSQKPPVQLNIPTVNPVVQEQSFGTTVSQLQQNQIQEQAHSPQNNIPDINQNHQSQGHQDHGHQDQGQGQPQLVDENKKKQEQIKKIKELCDMNQAVRMAQWRKMQQISKLKQIQEQKEAQDKKYNDRNKRESDDRR